MNGYVFDMQHYSLHDGPGIRTLVFLKGCPLSCHWCSNPESQTLSNQVLIIGSECIGLDKCGLCKEACQKHCITSEEKHLYVKIDRSVCDGCGDCASVCPGSGLQSTNQRKTIDEVLSYVMEDQSYYRKSGGGVTLSGGEPLYQYEFCMKLLEEFKRNGLHVAIETTAYCEPEKLKAAAKYIDLFLIDIKHADTREHKKYTGVGNERILDNIKMLAALGKTIEIRIPLIPGVNDSPDNMIQTADFVCENVKGAKVTLLPYHRLGNIKYQQLGSAPPLSKLKPINIKEDPQYFEKRQELFRVRGIEASY